MRIFCGNLYGDQIILFRLGKDGFVSGMIGTDYNNGEAALSELENETKKLCVKAVKERIKCFCMFFNIRMMNVDNRDRLLSEARDSQKMSGR